MSRVSYVAQRVVGVVVSVWAVFTLVFAAFAFRPKLENPYASRASSFGKVGGRELPAAEGDPLFQQYLDWLAWFVTGPKEAVTGPVVEAAKYTVAYLVPALLIAVLVGTLIRLYTVFADRDVYDSLVDGATLIGVSIPVFLLAFLLRRWLLVHFFGIFGFVRIYAPWAGPWSSRNLKAAIWPGTAMTVYLLAIQLRYAGEELQEYESEDFVKTARAKGLGTLRVGRHVFRNTSIMLLSVFLTDMYGMVVIGIFVVEFIYGTPGISVVLIDAFVLSNLKLILVLGVISVSVGVAANFVQDIAYMLFDPRVDIGE